MKFEILIANSIGKIKVDVSDERLGDVLMATLHVIKGAFYSGHQNIILDMLTRDALVGQGCPPIEMKYLVRMTVGVVRVDVFDKELADVLRRILETIKLSFDFSRQDGVLDRIDDTQIKANEVLNELVTAEGTTPRGAGSRK